LVDFIKSIKAERKTFLDNFVKPIVLCIFPPDIFESERIFLRDLMAQSGAREIYLSETYSACILSLFTISNTVGKETLCIGERSYQSIKEVKNLEYSETKMYDNSNTEVYDMDFDLVISNKSIDPTKFKTKLILQGEELRIKLIQGIKRLSEHYKIFYFPDEE
ncbi:MAG: hypothetical protein SFU98_07005, partial [Leptospiraceae bacterium]|nr:hypothetical protein [Leptospiraceae bacterium]